MFEKEAEEYLDKRYLKDMGVRKPCKQAFLAGAEFGYNKANEWHYVKDGDYPKDNKPVLCILGDVDLDNCKVGYYDDVESGEPWHFKTYYLPDDDGDNAWGVSAWKEIVLPESKECEE